MKKKKKAKCYRRGKLKLYVGSTRSENDTLILNVNNAFATDYWQTNEKQIIDDLCFILDKKKIQNEETNELEPLSKQIKYLEYKEIFKAHWEEICIEKMRLIVDKLKDYNIVAYRYTPM